MDDSKNRKFLVVSADVGMMTLREISEDNARQIAERLPQHADFFLNAKNGAFLKITEWPAYVICVNS